MNCHYPVRRNILLGALLLIVSLQLGVAQVSPINPWQYSGAGPDGNNTPRSSRASSISYWKLDLGYLQEYLGQGKDHSVIMPLPNGTTRFEISRSGLMSAELQRKFPSIRTYVGTNPDDPSMMLRFDLTSQGFHGMILSHQGTVYIDPQNTGKRYRSYYKKRAHKAKRYHSCLLDNTREKEKEPHTFSKSTGATRVISLGSKLRKYRLAVTASGEYTAFHQGTVPGALEAIVTTMNRVVGIFERELAITMELVDNTDQLIYTNALTDPYTITSTSNFKSQVQATIDDVIGNSNYDIGHGFSTGMAGQAEIGGVCRPNLKAQGVTGLDHPAGDPFDVDFVAHEIGHQFGATHTFNGNAGQCAPSSRSAETAYEPGSGTTIMGYAGTCISQDIQSNSNDYFHSASLEQITTFTTTGAGSSCPALSDTNNRPPLVDAGDGGFFIPVLTPFRLEGSATDPDGHTLTYCWEQFDLGPIGNPDLPRGNAPLFRSFPPVAEPYRVFPQISDVLDDKQTLGEILPSTNRELTFRLTARDNQLGGGGVGFDTLRFKATDEAGPFTITSQAQPGEEISGGAIYVVWEVARTDRPPVSCRAVNILLSIDGGFTFPHVLAEATPNDGAELIILPNVSTTQARIKVEAADNIFFDISGVDFSISEAANPGFFLAARTGDGIICSPGQVSYEVIVGSLKGFDKPVKLMIGELPAGMAAAFSDSTVIPGNTTQLAITNPSAAQGTYSFVISGLSDTLSEESTIDLGVIENPPETPSSIHPSQDAINVDLQPSFSWHSPAEDNMSYEIDVATDANFIGIIASDSGLVDTAFDPGILLLDNRQYFWRVRSNTVCNASEYGQATFKTIPLSPVQTTSQDVPTIISVGAPATYRSQLEVKRQGTIYDVNVSDLIGEHSWLSDLRVTLKSPAGTEVVLFSRICSRSEDFNLKFDDQASLLYDNILCPPIGGNTFQPLGSLADFNGENAEGTWTLIIRDMVNRDGGRLLSWGLDIFLEEDVSAPFAPDNLSVMPISPDQVDLRWEDNSTDEQAFVIERSQNNNVFYEEIARVEANVDSLLDESLTGQGLYYYRVKAINEGGSSLYSDEVELSIVVGLDPDAKKFSFYPNPTDRWLHITGTKARNDFQVIITDTSGKRLASYNSRNLDIPQTIDLEGLMPGLYLIYIFNEDHVVKQKFIKL